MPTKRQIRFLDAVADAARSAPLPRGKPKPSNLTEQGRRKGLAAMRNAPRCRSTTKAGTPCKNAAMRGASRCLKHGGRVEVPEHPHNIRRFMSGQLHAYYEAQDRFVEGLAAWDRLTLRDQQELAASLPVGASESSQRLYAAALLMERHEAGKISLMDFHRQWQRLTQ